MWTHERNNLQVEYPQKGTIERKGFSAKYKSKGGANWLHFAIPTPVMGNDMRLRVGSILTRFRCGGDGFMKAIHVYDGENKIAAKDNLKLSPKQWHVERVDVLTTPQI